MKSKKVLPFPKGKAAPPALTKAVEKVFPRGVVMKPKKGKSY